MIRNKFILCFSIRILDLESVEIIYNIPKTLLVKNKELFCMKPGQIQQERGTGNGTKTTLFYMKTVED